MIVCHCKGVTDRQIRRAVREGARDRDEIVMSCSAGSHCGGCASAIDEIIDRECERALGSGLLGIVELAAG